MKSILVLGVSQINRYVKSVLEEDVKLTDLYIKGEISNFTYHYRSGHFYLSLKDEKSVIKAVMFKSYASTLPFMPENGMNVIVRASLSVYERDGIYQLYITDMQPDGAGALAVAFEQIKSKLALEGLFEERYKKPIPAYPRIVGVVTSENGAALQDIINVMSRRYPLAKLLVSPAPVQGKDAEQALIRALKLVDGQCDVIIIGRGGGSSEDLWCFNGENLARAIFMAETPVISAVGHETDYTICDFVADVCAPTPSAAAEITVPSIEEIMRHIQGCGEYMRKTASDMLFDGNARLDALAGHPALRDPMRVISKKQEKIDYLSEKLYNNKKKLIMKQVEQLSKRAAILDSLSPLRVLERGYTAVFRGGQPTRSAGELKKGDIITIRFHDGEADANVVNIIKTDSKLN